MDITKITLFSIVVMLLPLAQIIGPGSEGSEIADSSHARGSAEVLDLSPGQTLGEIKSIFRLAIVDGHTVGLLSYPTAYPVGFDGKTLGEVAPSFGLDIIDGNLEIPLTPEDTYQKIHILDDSSVEILELYNNIEALGQRNLVYRKAPIQEHFVDCVALIYRAPFFNGCLEDCLSITTDDRADMREEDRCQGLIVGLQRTPPACYNLLSALARQMNLESPNVSEALLFLLPKVRAIHTLEMEGRHVGFDLSFSETPNKYILLISLWHGHVHLLIKKPNTSYNDNELNDTNYTKFQFIFADTLHNLDMHIIVAHLLNTRLDLTANANLHQAGVVQARRYLAQKISGDRAQLSAGNLIRRWWRDYRLARQ